MKFNTLVNVFAAVIVATSGCYNDYNDDQQTNVTSEEQTDFNDLRLELIKMKLLNGLGLTKPPKLDRGQALMLKTSIVKLPINTQPLHYPMDNRVRKPKDSKKYTFGKIGIDNSCTNPHLTSNETIMSFKLPDYPANIDSIMLTLRVADEDISDSRMTLTICNCAGIAFKSVFDRITKTYLPKCKQIVDDLGWRIAKSGWSHITFSSTAWKSITGYKDREILLVINKKVHKNDDKPPFLTIVVSSTYKPITLKRYKREINGQRNKIDCPEVNNNSTENNSSTLPCCRTRFWVDIRQLGWSDWIISPSGFYFYYCSGRCLNGFDRIDDDVIDYTSVLNAYIKTLNLKLRPCCISKKTSSLAITMITNGHSAIRTVIPNFIVEECACIGFKT